MSIQTIGKFALGAAATLYFGYQVSRHFFSKTNSSTTIEAQAVKSCDDMRTVQSLFKAVEQSTKLTSPYSVTLPLLASSYLKDTALFKTYEQAQYNSFNIHKDDSVDSIVQTLKEKPSENAWLLGRLLLSYLKMGDQAAASKIASVMEQLLEPSQVDPFASWAWGYLAIFYAVNKPEEYPKIQQKMMECIHSLMQDPREKGKDNVLWALVMALPSLAEAKEKATYESCLKYLKEFSGKDSITAALETIPPEDFRAWAASITLQFAKKTQDPDLVRDLQRCTIQAIAASPSVGDKLLARLVMDS